MSATTAEKDAARAYMAEHPGTGYTAALRTVRAAHAAETDHGTPRFEDDEDRFFDVQPNYGSDDKRDVVADLATVTDLLDQDVCRELSVEVLAHVAEQGRFPWRLEACDGNYDFVGPVADSERLCRQLLGPDLDHVIAALPVAASIPDRQDTPEFAAYASILNVIGPTQTDGHGETALKGAGLTPPLNKAVCVDEAVQHLNALAARHLITDGTRWDQDTYDRATWAYRVAFGRLHPDDPAPTPERSRQLLDLAISGSAYTDDGDLATAQHALGL